MRDLIYFPAALRDLEQVKGWYQQRGAGLEAARKLRTIRGAIRRLREDRWSLSGIELGQGDRMLVTEGHVVFYRLAPAAVIILRVYGPGQDRLV
jgi:plasmid stabilization system protein ParE